MAGDVSNKVQLQRLRRVCQQLDRPSSCLRRFAPAGAPCGSVIEVITIHSCSRHEIEFLDFPAVLRPFSHDQGYDYWKIFANVIDGGEVKQPNTYGEWGVDKRDGALVVVRHDQHVSLMCSLDDFTTVDQFFAKLFVNQHAE